MTATANTSVSVGNDSAELLTATAVGLVSGSGGNDTIQGAINGVAPGSTLDGGIGDDSLYSRGIGDIVLGGDGDDNLRNDSGQASLFGGAGDDVIIGEDRQTTVFGGGGDDSIVFTDKTNVAFGGSGNDEMIGLNGGDIFAGGDGNDYLEAATVGNDPSIMFGNAGNDTIVLSDTASDSGFGGQGADYIFAGSDATADNQFLFGNYGADVIEYLGKGKGVILDGDRAIDGVGGYFPASGTDAGADVFTLASSGTDFAEDITIAGGGGNDSISGTLGAGAAVYMGKGDDYFNIVSSGSSLITGDLGNDSGTIVLGGDDTLFGDGASQGSDATLGDDNLILTGDGGNVIFGDTESGTDGGDDNIDVTGLGSGNVVYGGGGDDELSSAGGNTLIGGAGNDVYSFGAGDVIPFDSLGINTYIAGSGASTSDVVTVQAGDSFTGGATFLVTGEAELIKTLTNGGVIASDEKDLIQIGTVDGVTSLKGGDDTFSGVNLTGSGAVDGGSGSDLITFTGTSIGAGKIVGGDGNDSIGFTDASATVSANISGGAGNDSLQVAGIFAGSFSGGDGVDTINIGTLAAGAVIDAGAGDERIAVTALGTSIGVASVFGGAGNDTITVGSDATGTATDVAIDGGEGDDIIYGKLYGGDTISGGAGNDTLFGGGFGTTYVGTSSNFALGDVLTGGAGKDVFILGTTGKTGFTTDFALDGTNFAGIDGVWLNGTNAADAATKTIPAFLNGTFNIDVITDFNATDDVIVLNTLNAFTLGTQSFEAGSIGYLGNNPVAGTGGLLGVTGDGLAGDLGTYNTLFGLIGETPTFAGAYDAQYGAGYVALATGTGREFRQDLTIGGTAFVDGGATNNTFTVTSAAGPFGFFGFSTAGTASAELAVTGLTYDTDTGALYYGDGTSVKLMALFTNKPALTAANFTELGFSAAGGVSGALEL